MPGEGAIPASVVAARERLAAALLERVEDEVSEVRVVEARDEIHSLVDAVLAADLSLELVLKLLGGRRPAASEERAGTFDGKVARGRLGAVRGELAAADIAAAKAVQGDLLHDAHCAAGGRVPARDPSFGLVELARHDACGGDGTLSMERGTRLFD
eukprot:5682187-Pleurochrysis_carterae.AAC.1